MHRHQDVHPDVLVPDHHPGTSRTDETANGTGVEEVATDRLGLAVTEQLHIVRFTTTAMEELHIALSGRRKRRVHMDPYM